MTFLVTSFLTSLLITLLLVRSAEHHGVLSADSDLSGPQKFHTRAVPRIGGIGVLAAMLAGSLFAHYAHAEFSAWLWLLLACGLPAFLAGVAEDLTKNVSPRRRLLSAAVSAGLGVWLLDAVVRRTDIPGIDQLIKMAPFAIALTLLVVTGMANAVNIIDGFNGLASMCVLIMVLSIAYVAFQVGDTLIVTAALITAGSVLGFFVWNFPAGLIFLGDGGAYLLGFTLAELSVLLLSRNPGVSPIFVLLLCAYPIVEVLFTMYRRKVVRGVATAAPDRIHLHTLIHRRLIHLPQGASAERTQTARNSMTSPYLWVLCLLSVMPAMLWWDSTPILTGFLALFIASYIVLYWRIVRFRTPKWMIFRR